MEKRVVVGAIVSLSISVFGKVFENLGPTLTFGCRGRLEMTSLEVYPNDK